MRIVRSIVDIAHNFDLHVGRHGDINDFDSGIRQQFTIVRVDVWDGVATRHRFGLLASSRGDCNRVESRLPAPARCSRFRAPRGRECRAAFWP